MDRRWLLSGVLASILLLHGARGAAAEVTEVATAADEVRVGNFSKVNPFDLFLDNTFSFVRENGRIQRESVELAGVTRACGESRPRACRPQDELSYTRDTMAYGLRGQAGLYHDLALTFGWTYVVRQTLGFRYAPGVNADNSTVDSSDPAIGTLFPHRFESVHKGSGKLDLGLRWGVLSDLKDESKPTWVLYASWATPWAEQVYAPHVGLTKDQTARVGDGVHYLTFGTALSKRLGQLGLIGIDPNANRRGYLEPYFDVNFVLPIPGASTIAPLNPATSRPFASGPSYRGSFNTGFEIVASEDLANGRKVAIDLGLRTTYFAEGRNYSELTDPLGRATWTEQYLYVGGVLGIYAQVAGVLRFKASVTFGTSTSHWLTGEEVGRDRNEDGQVTDPAVDTRTPTDLWNPYYCGHSAGDACSPVGAAFPYDEPGFRFRDDSHFSVGGSVSAMLTF